MTGFKFISCQFCADYADQHYGRIMDELCKTLSKDEAEDKFDLFMADFHRMHTL